MSYLWLALAIVAELVGTLSLRASDGFHRRGWLVPMVVAYVLSFGFLAMALAAGMPVGAAYAIWSAVGIVMVALLARVIWRDPLTLRMLVGIAVITVGVVLVELG